MTSNHPKILHTYYFMQHLELKWIFSTSLMTCEMKWDHQTVSDLGWRVWLLAGSRVLSCPWASLSSLTPALWGCDQISDQCRPDVPCYDRCAVPSPAQCCPSTSPTDGKSSLSATHSNLCHETYGVWKNSLRSYICEAAIITSWTWRFFEHRYFTR